MTEFKDEIVLELRKIQYKKKVTYRPVRGRGQTIQQKQKSGTFLGFFFFLSIRTAAVNLLTVLLGSWNDELDSNRMADNRQMSFVQRQKVTGGGGEQMDARETIIWCYTFNDRHVSEQSVSTALGFSFSLSLLFVSLPSAAFNHHHLWPSLPCPPPDKLNSRAASLSSFLFLSIFFFSIFPSPPLRG